MNPPISGDAGTPLRAGVITMDPQLPGRLRSVAEEREDLLDLAVVVDASFREVGDSELDRLREVDPDVVFLDLDKDPQVGLRFARFLLDSELADAVVGVGGDLSTQLLLEAMRSGVANVVPKPVTPEGVEEALERLRPRRARVAGGSMDEKPSRDGKIITVFSAKGGVGATTLAVNLAVEIRRLSKGETALIDLDLELGETALLLGVDPRFSVVDLFKNFHRIDSDLLASYIERHESGVELLSAPYQPVDYESVSGERVRKVLDFLRDHYDWIVVDASKTFNSTTLETLAATDLLLLMTTADLQSLRNVTRSLPLLRSLKGEDTGDDWIELVLNRFASKQAIGLRDIRDTLDVQVDWTLTNDYDAVVESINEGEPLVLRNGTDYARDVRRIASDITGVEVEEEAGFLDNILNPFRKNSGAGSEGRRREGEPDSQIRDVEEENRAT